MKTKISIRQLTQQITSKVIESVDSMAMPEFIPSGIQDFDVIQTIAKYAQKERTLILNVQCNNKQGKTTIAANVLKNIFWDNDPVYFDYPIFKDWPYTDDEYDPDGVFIKTGPVIKRFRIIGTSKNIEDSGPIKAEIGKWWPSGRYTKIKASKHYYREYETDTGWFGDMMSFEQEPKEFEGDVISVTWIDEPAKGSIMGAISSRHWKGGLILITQTPVGAGPMLDILDDLKEKGALVINVYSDIYENSVSSGKLNSKGTKRGLMTDEGIENYISTIPIVERPARIFGKHVGKSGKIFPMYDDMVHVKDYELDADYAKLWNCYCVCDPHDKYYPFIQWWAVTPPNIMNKSYFICYNEWPTFQTLAGYYDEKRNSVECKLSPEIISQIIKLQDGSNYGLQIIARILDPMFERNTRTNWSKKTEGIVLEYQRHGIIWSLPKPSTVQAQTGRIMELLTFDSQRGINVYNEPLIHIMPHCRNSRRSFERHYWLEGKDQESDQYKDPMDCAKMFFAYISNKTYQEIYPDKKAPQFKPVKAESLFKELKEIGLG